MTALTPAQGTRYRSTYARQNLPTKVYGSNPPVLAISNVTAQAARAYLKFNIPAAVLRPTTDIIAASLTIQTRYSWPHSHSTDLYLVGEEWDSHSLTWTDRPAVSGSPVTVTKSTAPDKTKWVYDVTAQVVAMQTLGNNGWELRLGTGTSDTHTIYNDGDYVAHLTIEYDVKPPTPTATSPGNNLVVSEPQPILSVTAPLGEHAALNVQISATQNGVAPDWEVSGYDDHGTFAIDLATEAGAPSLAASASTYYRMALVSAGGQASDWSPWTRYTYIPFGTATITEPADEPDNIVYDPSPPFVWDFPNQTAYQLIISDPDVSSASSILWDSGVVPSDAQTATPPAVCNVSGHTYRARLLLWDNAARVVHEDALDHLELVRDFEFQLEASVLPVTSLVANDLAPKPFVQLTWQRSTPPDFFQILRDGVQVAYVSAAETLVSGDDYAWIDLLADPRREHTWTVRAVVNGETALANPTQTLAINPSGLWLSQPDSDRFLPIITLDEQSVSLTEDGQTVAPLNSEFSARAETNQRDYSGTITGEILATELTDAATGASLRDLFIAMRKDRGAATYLTLLDRNIKIVPFNMTVAPTPTIGRDEDYVYAMSFDFIEVP